MMTTRERITGTLLDIQNAFLDTPGLALTLKEARLLFGVDEMTCAAVLKTLVEAGVLSRTHGGSYVRRFPLETAA